MAEIFVDEQKVSDLIEVITDTFEIDDYQSDHLTVYFCDFPQANKK